MPSRLTRTSRNGTSDRWHAIPHEHRVATLASVTLLLLGVLSSLRFVAASDMTVGFTVTDGTSSSSSTSPSSSPATSSFSSSASSSPSGNSRRTTETLEVIIETDVSYMLTEKMLPGCELDEWQLPPGSPPRYYCNMLHAATDKEFPYTDVSLDIWYRSALVTFLDLGVLDTSKTRFHGNETALRAEFATVLGRLHGDVPTMHGGLQHFDDAVPDSWYQPFVEFAGTKGWMRGYDDCIGTHPCIVMPASTITRAEAVAMIVRYFGLTPLETAPTFPDVPPDAWYASDIAIAADRCIMLGSGTARRAHPNDKLNRAEMMVLLDRARRNLVYGIDCSSTASSSSSLQRSVSSSSLLSTSPSASVSSLPQSVVSSNNTSSNASSSSAHAAAAATITNPVDTPPNDGPSGLTLTTMLMMGLLVLTIAGRFFMSAKGSGL